MREKEFSTRRNHASLQSIKRDLYKRTGEDEAHGSDGG